MADIEPSEILYRENNALYMTARVLCSSDTETPQLLDVSFILTEKALVTVRYGEPRSFAMFMSRVDQAGRLPPPAGGGSRRIDRDGHRSRGRNSCTGRQAHRLRVAGNLRDRTQEGASNAGVPGGPALHRTKGRCDFERAREHGVGGADAAFPLGRDAPSTAGARLPGRMAHGAARRAIDRGTRHVPVEQGAVSSRRELSAS